MTLKTVKLALAFSVSAAALVGCKKEVEIAIQDQKTTVWTEPKQTMRGEPSPKPDADGFVEPLQSDEREEKEEKEKPYKIICQTEGRPIVVESEEGLERADGYVAFTDTKGNHYELPPFACRSMKPN